MEVVGFDEGFRRFPRRYKCEGVCAGNDAGECRQEELGARISGAEPDGETSNHPQRQAQVEG